MRERENEPHVSVPERRNRKVHFYKETFARDRHELVVWIRVLQVAVVRMVEHALDSLLVMVHECSFVIVNCQ